MSRARPGLPPAAPPPGLELEEAICPMGCKATADVVVTGFDRQHRVGGRFPVVRCRDCGLLRTTPRPTRQTIAAYYPASYAPYQRCPARIHASRTPRRGPRGALVRLADPRSEWTPDLAPGRMVEFGCSSGVFMQFMAAKGWRVTGIEPSPDASARAREAGLDVLTGSLEEAPNPPGPAQLVVGWMVFEHLHDPRLALARFRDWVAPDGWLALSVPDCGGLEARAFGDAWWALDVPRHLFHYTPTTLTRLMAAEGWRVERVFHQRTLANAVASLGYSLCDLGARRAGSHLVQAPDRGGRWVYAVAPFAAAAAALGQTGRITVWARLP